jgi:hypothetical protein
MNLGSDDAEGQARNAAFLQGLQELDWTVGRNSTRLGRVCRNLLRRHFPRRLDDQILCEAMLRN